MESQAEVEITAATEQPDVQLAKEVPGPAADKAKQSSLWSFWPGAYGRETSPVAAVLKRNCESLICHLYPPVAALAQAGSQFCHPFQNLRGQTGIPFKTAGRPGQNGGHPCQKLGD